MKTTPLRLALFTSLGLSLVACDSEKTPEPAAVRQGVAQNLAAVLPELQAALNSEASARVPIAEAERLVDMIQPGSGEVVLARATQLHSLVEEPALDAGKLSGLLERHLFNDANHRGGGVYPIPAQLVCATTYDPVTGEPGAEIDLECEAELDRFQPKIKVRGDASELEFSLLLGPSESEPLALTLSKTAVALHFDLGETAEVIKDLYEGPAPNFRAAGRVAVGLEVLGPKHVEVRVEIENKVDLAYAEAGVALDSAQAVRFSSEKSKVFAVEIDGVAESVTASLAVGATKVHTPGEGTLEPMIDLDLPGLSGALTMQKDQPVKITNISLGDRPLTIDANGARAATINLNPEHGRKLDITVSETAGEASMVFAPAFDLRMDIDNAKLGEIEEQYQVTRVLIDGTTPTLSSQLGLLRVTSGRFQVTTDPVEFGVEATAGQCVAEKLLGGLEVVTCPVL